MFIPMVLAFGATQGPYKTTHTTVVNPGQDKSNQKVDVVYVFASCLVRRPTTTLHTRRASSRRTL